MNKDEPSLDDTEVLSNFILKWKAKREKNVAVALNCHVCVQALDDFETTYGVTLDDNMKDEILNNTKSCWNTEKFNCETNKYLFFQRADIQQIIADNSLLDPCNPDLTSNDILDLYANGNCSDNLGSKSIDGIYEDIGEEQDIIIDQLDNKRLKCIWKKFQNVNDKIFCNSISNFFGTGTPINLVLYDEYYGDAGFLALTANYKNGSFISITINQSVIDRYCEIVIYESFLHEGIHAEIFRQLHPLNPDKNHNTPLFEVFNNFKQIFVK